MGTARSFIAMATFGLVTSCSFEASSTQTAAPAPPPTERPAAYGVPRPIGGSTYQWSLMITVDALGPSDDNWYSDQDCNTTVEMSTSRQRLFAERLDVALTDILSRNAHCAVATLAPLAYGQNGCNDYYAASQPSGVYAVFSCTNSELSTTQAPPPAPQP